MDPIAFIPASILVNIHSESMCLVIEKFSNINVTSTVPESSFAIGFVILPLAFVNGSILPFVDAVAMSFLSLFLLVEYHLSFEFRIVGEFVIIDVDEVGILN
jgi:hypothetical protein